MGQLNRQLEKNETIIIIIYFEKLRKKQKKWFAIPDLGFESRLNVKKVLVPYNVRLKTIPFIKYAKMNVIFLEYLFYKKIKENIF